MNNNRVIQNNIKYGVDYTGPHTVMHHQCHQMVDLVMRHCKQTMHGLNPYALPCIPSQHQESEKKEGNKHQEEEINKFDEVKCDWKIPRKTKRNVIGKESNAPIALQHINTCSSLEDEEKSEINKHVKCNVDDMILDQSQNMLRNYKVKNVVKKIKVKVDVEDMSAEEIEDAIDKHTEKYPNDSPFTGMFQRMDDLKKNLMKRRKKKMKRRIIEITLR